MNIPANPRIPRIHTTVGELIVTCFRVARRGVRNRKSAKRVGLESSNILLMQAHPHQGV